MTGLRQKNCTQRAIDFRDRLRAVKHEAKLKLTMISDRGDLYKLPNVIQEIQKVEYGLDGRIAHPRNLSRNPPDYRTLARQVVHALSHEPFKCERKLPDPNRSSREVAAKIANDHFSRSELNKLTATVLGMELPGRAIWAEPRMANWGPYLRLVVRPKVDALAAGEVQTQVDFMPPEAMPGWAMDKTGRTADGATYVDIRQMSEPRPGAHIFKAHAAFKWEGGEVALPKNIEWVK